MIARFALTLLLASSSGLAANDPHPLPLAAQWNVGAWPGSFDPDFQVTELKAGRPLLLTFNLEPPDARLKPDYYTQATRYGAAKHLPISIISLQWEMVLPRVSKAYAEGQPVSPFGPIEPWYAAGRMWGEHPQLKEMQALYPDPPLVVFVSNNEHPRMAWTELRKAVGANASDEDVRRIVGDAWVVRYRELIRGFRDGLTKSAWREHTRFAAYDAFSQQAAGRWWGWANYSLHTSGHMEPWSRAWEGVSASYYVHDWMPDADDLVWSPQIEAMNWVPVLAQVLNANPQYWFELSTWDGQAKDKAKIYSDRGQTLSPARTAGMAQFGLWLLRPRVLREFRLTTDGRERFGSYFNETLNAVRRVHELPTLTRFWESGALVANPSNAHPYTESLPADFAASARWFLLDSPANPPRPWKLDTPIEIYSLALQLEGEWLVYAFAPRHESWQAQVQIPGGPRVTVAASAAGCFSQVTAKGQVATITCGSRVTPARVEGVKIERSPQR